VDPELEPDEEGALEDASVATSRTGRRLVADVVGAFERDSNTKRTDARMTARSTYIHLEVFDPLYPLTVDILGGNLARPRGVVYMLPGGASNFRSSFMTPPADNLAHYFRRHGYLVVGISPREDAVPRDAPDLSFMKGWDMAQHRADVRAVVERVQGVVQLPYELLGHSYGAATALDYAGAYPGEAQRVFALDIYSIDPVADRGAMRNARYTHQAYVDLMRDGVLADTSYADFPELARQGLLRTRDGGAQRQYDYEGYTSKQMLLFGMIYSSYLPGVHTPLTGLPGDWPMAQSTVAGDEGWEFRPSDDERTFARTSMATLALASQALGGGLVSMAFARDYWSVVAQSEGAHLLRWSSIVGPVVWVNSELGYAGQTHGADLIRAGGNTQVEVQVVEDYGHADMLWSRTAREDVWSRLLPP